MTGPEGVRAELAEAVRRRRVGLLDRWLGPADVKLEILSVLLAGRNLLLEGPVGSGKTLLGTLIAAALPPLRLAGCHFNCLPGRPECPQCRAGLTPPEPVEVPGPERFVRIQGSPDLFPEDLVGDIDPAAALTHGVLDPRAFRPGRLVRANRRVCFVDEINRLSERLQNLFLELLAEGALTVGGYEARFPVDTVVVATMNPEEYVGVGRLSEALRDRFERVRLGYPAPDDEVRILLRAAPDGDRHRPEAETIVAFANRLRDDPEVEAGPSVRATLAAYELAVSHHQLHGTGPGGAADRMAAVRAGLHLAFRGRLTLRVTHPLAGRPEVFLDEALGRLSG